MLYVRLPRCQRPRADVVERQRDFVVFLGLSALLPPVDASWLFERFGYTGDYSFIFFE